MLNAFDSDCLIYAANPGHPLGIKVASLFVRGTDPQAGIGSTLLLPELTSKPLRSNNIGELNSLTWMLNRLQLHSADHAVCEFASVLSAEYRLKAADAIHLATAVIGGADRFITNNRRYFDQHQITEIAVVYPDQL